MTDVVDYQALAGVQGRNWEDVVLSHLKFQGWTVTSRHLKIDGVEIDIVAIDPHGETWWIECKGSHRGKVPGCLRDDTVKKAVGVAYHLLHGVLERRPYMLITSHMPKAGSKSRDMLERAVAAGAFQRVGCLGDCL